MAAPYAYGSMARTESMLVAWMPVGPRSCRLDLVDFFVRMWRLNAWPRFTLPLPRTRRRFLAPDLVFIFGMSPFLICCPRWCSPWGAAGPALQERLCRHRWIFQRQAYQPRACRSDAFPSAPAASAPAPSSEPAASP